MTKESLAVALNGREMGEELTPSEEKSIKKEGLVVVFGASDDLCEFRGAIKDEFDCYDGGALVFDRKGQLPDWEDVAEDEAEEYARRKKLAVTIQALWSVNGYSWMYSTGIPHACFDIMEGEESYCRGIVFSLEDLPK